MITNEASRELEKVRKRIAVVKERIQKKLQSVMARHAAILQENIVSVRGGRYVIPVRKDYYKQVNGRMLDQSTSGQTVFIEPQEVSALQSEPGIAAGRRGAGGSQGARLPGGAGRAGSRGDIPEY